MNCIGKFIVILFCLFSNWQGQISQTSSGWHCLDRTKLIKNLIINGIIKQTKLLNQKKVMGWSDAASIKLSSFGSANWIHAPYVNKVSCCVCHSYSSQFFQWPISLGHCLHLSVLSAFFTEYFCCAAHDDLLFFRLLWNKDQQKNKRAIVPKWLIEHFRIPAAIF